MTRLRPQGMSEANYRRGFRASFDLASTSTLLSIASPLFDRSRVEIFLKQCVEREGSSEKFRLLEIRATPKDGASLSYRR